MLVQSNTKWLDLSVRNHTYLILKRYSFYCPLSWALDLLYKDEERTEINNYSTKRQFYCPLKGKEWSVQREKTRKIDATVIDVFAEK